MTPSCSYVLIIQPITRIRQQAVIERLRNPVPWLSPNSCSFSSRLWDFQCKKSILECVLTCALILFIFLKHWSKKEPPRQEFLVPVHSHQWLCVEGWLIKVFRIALPLLWNLEKPGESKIGTEQDDFPELPAESRMQTQCFRGTSLFTVCLEFCMLQLSGNSCFISLRICPDATLLCPLSRTRSLREGRRKMMRKNHIQRKQTLGATMRGMSSPSKETRGATQKLTHHINQATLSE